MAPAHSRPPSLLISTPSPARPVPSSSQHHHNPSTSPFRYVQLQDFLPEKVPPPDPLAAAPTHVDHPLSGPSRAPAGGAPLSPAKPTHEPHTYPAHPAHAPHTAHTTHTTHPLPRAGPPPPLPPQHRGRPQGIRIPDRLKPWLGIGSWAMTSIGFLLAIAFWKKEVFTGLDQLSLHLQSLGNLGYAILFCLIFITTIPPFPLYSTLIILSGYTFGVWTGALISYVAALSGAVLVFLLSRHYLRGYMSRLLQHTTSLKRVVRAIEKRPKLLLLIRVAPYPYNLMNVLLASSHTLTFSTYFTCTALSLVKVVIHTSVGSGIHSFAGYHAGEAGEASNGLGRVWTVIGIMLCIAILVYLSIVARRAVDEELEEDAGLARAEEGEGALLAEMREVSPDT